MNRNFTKKTASLVLAIVLVLGSLSTAFAAESTPQAADSSLQASTSTSQNITEKDIRQKLESMGYKVQYIKKATAADRKNAVSSTSNTLSFDTIEQFSQFDKEIFSESINAPTKGIPNNANSLSASSLTASGTATASAWAPYANGTVFCFKNVDFNYKASWYTLAGYYTLDSVSKPKSYISGLNIAVTWTQTAISKSIDETGLHAKFSVRGYFTFGVKIGDFNVGATKKDSWNLTSDDINDFID